MTTQFIGTTFPPGWQWHQDEVDLIASIKQQIDIKYPNDQNLFINTTWFGPQFNNNEYKNFCQLRGKKFDRLILLAAADPAFLNDEQIEQLARDISAQETLLLGHFDTDYQFNFHSRVLLKYFQKYNFEDLKLRDPNYVYLNYNRKPRVHRIGLVNLLVESDLAQCGIITLGVDPSQIYSQGVQAIQNFTLNEAPEDFAKEGNWGMSNEFGIPHDIHSLGNMKLWQQHFLTVISETQFNPWDPMVITEKTWKPIIGLRPFVINGQTKIYKHLRENGFKTFNEYWPVDVENIAEYQVHEAIVNVIKYLKTLSISALTDIYNSMLPDLLHNQRQFQKFAQEQNSKMENLF